MTLYTPQPPWRYAVFQVFAGLTVLFLLLALLTPRLGWFPHFVSVHIALDLSSSTYQATQVFKGPGSIMQQEIDAVKTYVDKNASLPSPNLVSVSGFADRVVPITSKFSSNKDEIYQAIEQVVQPSLASQLGGGTNINLALENGLFQLKSQASTKCKQILIITDGVFKLDPDKVTQANSNGVKLNFLIVGQSLNAEIDRWAKATGGLAISVNPNSISELLAGQIFNRFNTSPLIALFWGLAWISFMWMMLLPIDRFLSANLKIRVDKSGLIALYNAFFWTLATPAILWLMGLVNPFQKC